MKSSRTYQHVLPLAEGGMGRVELAMRSESGFERLYAVKRLHPQLRADEAFRTMFLDEARVAGLLRHSNVVSVLDVGEDEDGPFLVMDYVEGLTLSMILKFHARTRQYLPLQLALRIAEQIALGLHAAHDLRDSEGHALELVHRDVSPQNVLVGFDGVVRVMDFGIAKAIGRGTRTSTGVLKGKLSYMSPEQLRFEEATRASDLFAFGLVLFELVGGRHPYPGEGMERARHILNDPQPDLGERRRGCPPELVQLAFELLAPDPVHRPESAGEVAERLRAIITDAAALEGPLSIDEYMRRVHGGHQQERREEITTAVRAMRSAFRRRRFARRRTWALGALVALLTLGGGAMGFRWAEAALRPPRALAASKTHVAPPTDTPSAAPEEVTAEPSAVADAAGDAGAAAEPEAQADTRPATPRPRRRGARRTSRRSREGGPPIWDW
ncbi:MAG: serine/threonine-protein kinase [Myxococcota bacterium]|nr:serine/threonine-protein kinase [Myxococcota bacterium]